MSAELPAYVCSHVFNREKPVLLVAHSDGDWQLLCGGSHDAAEIPHVVGFNHLLDSDPTLKAVLDLPDNWQAERSSVKSEWRLESQG